MKKLIVFSILSMMCIMAVAQEQANSSNRDIVYQGVDVVGYAPEPDPRLVGVWQRQETSPDNVGMEFIRFEINGSRLCVKYKMVGNDDDGKPFQRYYDGKSVMYSDDSVSFIVYLSERSYHDDDHLYWTVLHTYFIEWEGGVLKAKKTIQSYGADSQGNIINDQRSWTSPTHKQYRNSAEHYTYFKTNENW